MQFPRIRTAVDGGLAEPAVPGRRLKTSAVARVVAIRFVLSERQSMMVVDILGRDFAYGMMIWFLSTIGFTTSRINPRWFRLPLSPDAIGKRGCRWREIETRGSARAAFVRRAMNECFEQRNTSATGGRLRSTGSSPRSLRV
jgi:hypothetical protein